MSEGGIVWWARKRKVRLVSQVGNLVFDCLYTIYCIWNLESVKFTSVQDGNVLEVTFQRGTLKKNKKCREIEKGLWVLLDD